MAPQQELQDLLLTIVPNVYFQPPASVQMEYPCIVYARDNADTKFAGNAPYRFTQRYAVTVIDRNPNSDVLKGVAALPMCTYNRYFAADDLNHDVFQLYF